MHSPSNKSLYSCIYIPRCSYMDNQKTRENDDDDDYYQGGQEAEETERW